MDSIASAVTRVVTGKRTKWLVLLAWVAIALVSLPLGATWNVACTRANAAAGVTRQIKEATSQCRVAIMQYPLQVRDHRKNRPGGCR